MCVDYRQLNAKSVPDAYPLPRINHILERLRNAKYISTLALRNGYWQIPMERESRACTAFTVPGRGLFQWRVIPFGLHSAPATFQRALDSVKGPELDPFAFAYLADIIVVGSRLEEHMFNLGWVFKRLRRANLRINQEKCAFFKRKIAYLGHVISDRGIHTDPDKFPDYVVEDGELYRHLGHRPDDQDYVPWKLCIAAENRAKILQECHDAPAA
ncbi:hypothetical protein KR032_003498, partial [Drosophila birchii]